MQKERFNLPPLDLIQGFEAAARNLSLHQGGRGAVHHPVGRQPADPGAGGAPGRRAVRAPAPRAGADRARGARSTGRPASCWSGCRRSRTGCAPTAARRHLTVTTTSGFASLWLIPRLRGFTALHPDVDVRISATYKTVNLERSLVDVAVRYCQEEEAPEGAMRLFGEELFPVCSPALLARGPHPLRTLQDLSITRCCTWTSAGGFLDWGTWLAAQGYADLRPAASLRFDSYEQMIAARRSAARASPWASAGWSAACWRRAGWWRRSAKSVAGPRAYYVIRSDADGHAAARAARSSTGWWRRPGAVDARAERRPRSAPDHQRRGQPAQARRARSAR